MENDQWYNYRAANYSRDNKSDREALAKQIGKSSPRASLSTLLQMIELNDF